MSEIIYRINDDLSGFQKLITLWEKFQTSQYLDIDVRLSGFFSVPKTIFH